ncbi:MAG: acyltransferase [Sphingomonas sp.]|jgi:peptidoglycan/LPS O-acetylase OafA/YrhL
MTSAPNLRALTSLRGIAAWLVVLYHIRCSIAGLPPAWEQALGKGYLAVDFFFLLSGFVIWMTYAERLRAKGLAARVEFLQRRIARVWPLHVVMLAYGVALALLLWATGRHDPLAFPYAELPLHLFLMQNWGFTSDLSWNDPAWSISCEAAAYLCFALFATALDWRRWPTLAILAALAALFALLHLLFALGGAQTLGADIARYGLARCLIEFAAGTACYSLWQRWRRRAVAVAGWAAFVAAMLIGAAFAGALPETLAMPAALAALLVLAALTSPMRGNPLGHRALHYLGDISYATYLSHFLLFFTFKLAFVRDAAAVPWWQIIAYLLLVLGCSAVLYPLVERPAQRAINRWHRAPRRAARG